MALLLVMILLGVCCYFAIHGVYYVNEEGNMEYGITAVRKIKTAKKEWAGLLTEEKIKKVIEENARINATEESQSADSNKQNIAFGWKQGFSDIREMIVEAFCDFREYNYYVIDSMSPKDAKYFYTNRMLHLKNWLSTEAKDLYTEKEKEFLIRKYEEWNIPFTYDYADGWKQLLEFSQALIMIMALILGFITAGIFPCEFQWKASSIFYTAFHGRGKAITAKIKAGFLIITGIYWMCVLLYTGIVLGILGADGANCVIQTSRAGWKSFYNITYWQEYLLTFIGGYVGSLFILFLTMLVSAKTKSSILAVIIPFLFLFLPSFLSGFNHALLNQILCILPDQLLQTNMALSYFNLYEIGGRIVGAVWILPPLYAALFLILCPLIHRTFKTEKTA